MKQPFSIWWLHPAAAFGSICGALILAAMLIPDAVYRNLWFTPKFLNGESAALLIGFVAVFLTGCLAGGAGVRKSTPADPELASVTLLALYRSAMALTLFGYLVWGTIAIARGLNLAVIRGAFAGNPEALYDIRTDFLGSVPGVTTCTQFGVAAGVLGALIASRDGWRPVWKSLAFLFVLILLRVALNTERLAMIEVAVPMSVVVLTQVLGPLAQRMRGLRRSISAAPLAAGPLLFAVFAAFEYTRSWVYYASGPLSFWQFAAARLTGYYVTAANNGAYLEQRLNSPLGIPFFTLNFLWRLPVVHGLVESLFPGFQLTASYFDVLASNANAEFNNSGGLFAPALDFGWLGALVYWLLLGLLAGRIYSSFRRQSAWGLCLYPVLFLGLIDVPRGLYWSSGRAIPGIAFLVLSAFMLRVQQQRRTAHMPCPA